MEEGRPGPGGSTVYDVDSCQAAIQLAQEFLTKGKYDWFRGQVSESYSVVPTLFRSKDRRMAERTLDLFFNWVTKTRGLEQIAKEENHVYAVAQHYGLPTHFVDFTIDPSVAGFFAWDTKQPPPPCSKSVIICLNTRDLLEVALPDNMPKPECLTIHVPDLWRLQSQRGVFLVCPYSDFEKVVYTFDRIRFPYSAPTQTDRAFYSM